MRGWIAGFSLAAWALSMFQITSTPTYSQDIRPMLAAKCAVCHTSGGMAPFPLTTYQQAKRRADLIRLVCLTGQMPPTDALSDFGELTQLHRLSSKELVAIQGWVRAGMPEGAPTNPIVSMPRADKQGVTYTVGVGRKVPAEGRAYKIAYALEPKINSPESIQTFMFRPNAPQAVKQATIAVQRPGTIAPFTLRGIEPHSAVATWSPGYQTWQGFGAGLLVQPGDRIWIQLSVVPTGKGESAGGAIDIEWAETKDHVLGKTMGSSTFLIPSEKEIRLESEWTLDQDIDLISIHPEARFSTDQVRLAVRANGTEKVLLQVLTWDATWPGAYNFPNLVRLKKGTTLVYESLINNSSHGTVKGINARKPIRFGSRPTDELFWCHISYIPR